MDWLSDFGHWLLVSKGGLIVGSVLIWAGLVTLGGYLVWRYGEVRMGPDPQPKVDGPTVPIRVGGVYRWSVEPAPNYHRDDDPFPLAEFLAAVDEATTVVIDLTETVELRAVDPLDVTAEIEHVDPSVPLFYQIRRPRPYVAESFTQGIQRAQIERAKAAKELAP